MSVSEKSRGRKVRKAPGFEPPRTAKRKSKCACVHVCVCVCVCYDITCLLGVDNQECVQKFSEYLKNRYSSKERKKDLAPFKLAGIERKKAEDRRELDRYSRSTLRGDQDDIFYCKHPMGQDEIGCSTWLTDDKQPRLILIEGAPGVGKTTFSGEFCYKWSQGELLSDKLLVLLPLRENRVKSAMNVSDLFHHRQLKQEIAEQVESNGGEGVALWLEAWDELEEEKREQYSIFLDLVCGRVLPKATIIITSRPWATKKLKETSSGIHQHIEIIGTPAIQFDRMKNLVRSDVRDNLIDYVDKNPSIKAAMHTPVTADIVAEVFQWSQDTESPPPRTTTQLYKTLTCKLLSVKEEGKKHGRMGSLEEVAAERKGSFLNMCRLAWEWIIKRQLTFSSDVIAALGGDTLGLMHKVRELYGAGGEDSEYSYQFIHLTLQEFLSAYHITQLPQDEQDQIIREHIEIGHLNMVVRFYFALTGPNTFTSATIAEHLSDNKREPTAYHWLFEAGDGVPEELVSNKVVSVSSSYSWNPLDYYVVGYCISRYQNQWKLNFNNTSIGDEGMEMLSKGMASNTNAAHGGEIEGNFRKNQITSEGLKWFLDIPKQLLQQIKELDFGGDHNKMDGPALSTLSFCNAIPSMEKLQQLCLSSNPIGKGGAVEALKCLHNFKTPLKELDLAITGIGEEDCEQLALLTGLEDLDVSSNKLSSISIASIIDGQRKNNTIRKLHMSDSSLSVENCMSLSSLLEQPRDLCQLSELNISFCGITSEGAVHLGRALAKNHSLKELDIMDNPIGDKGAAAFGDMIRDNAVLETLYMTKCEIAHEGFVQLAEGLISNTSLKTLWLGGNQCGEEGVAVIIAGLQKNSTLKELQLSKEYQCRAGKRVEWI